MRKRRKQKVNPLIIERQDVIEEVRFGSAKMIRLSRVKYEGNDYTFVDLREFWRGYDDEGNDVFYPSSRGLQLKERDFVKFIDSYSARTEHRVRREVH
jgi:hypothetical protein